MNFALLLFSVIMIKVIKYKQKRVQKMKRFIKKRWKLEWMTEFLKPEPDQEKLTYIEYILECIDPLEYDQRLERGEFYCEHLKRRNVQKRRRRKKYLSAVAKVAVFVIMFIISAQVICYAITGKSIFRYINETNKETTEIHIEINDPSEDKSLKGILEDVKDLIDRAIAGGEGDAGTADSIRVSSWEEVIEKYDDSVTYPRYMPDGWKLHDILVSAFEDKVVGIIAAYNKGEDWYYYSYYDHSGEENGSEKIYFGEKRKKVKVLKVSGGEFSFYKGKNTLSVLGHIYQFEKNLDGVINIEEAEKIVKSIR